MIMVYLEVSRCFIFVFSDLSMIFFIFYDLGIMLKIASSISYIYENVCMFLLEILLFYFLDVHIYFFFFLASYASNTIYPPPKLAIQPTKLIKLSILSPSGLKSYLYFVLNWLYFISLFSFSVHGPVSCCFNYCSFITHFIFLFQHSFASYLFYAKWTFKKLLKFNFQCAIFKGKLENWYLNRIHKIT